MMSLSYYLIIIFTMMHLAAYLRFPVMVVSGDAYFYVSLCSSLGEFLTSSEKTIPSLLMKLRRRTVMRPPQVLREWTKKTVFVNFMDLCKTMHRQPEHVMSFLLAEMGTSGSLDGQQRLVVNGRFAPKNFEGILRTCIIKLLPCFQFSWRTCRKWIQLADAYLLLPDS